MDVERLKNFGSILTKDYFKKQLEVIREIRLSEQRFYQKITDLYSTALDYDPSSKTTIDFFKKVQNKLHWAIHRHTAAELIYQRADANKENLIPAELTIQQITYDNVRGHEMPILIEHGYI